MALFGTGALGVWHDIATGQEREADEWYNREHHAERIALPGFLRARRYLNLGDGPRYFSRYDVTSAAVLASQPYLDALNSPSQWSRRMFPEYRGTVRGAFDVIERSRIADGGSVATLRFSSAAVNSRADVEKAVLNVAAALGQAFGILAIEVWRVDPAATLQPTREKELRARNDEFPAYVLVLDGTEPGALTEALVTTPARPLLEAAERDIMRLAFHAEAPN
jgi:hypothetical protein